MAINLTKGSSINLTKEQPTVSKYIISVAWSTPMGENKYDVDLSAAVLTPKSEKNKLIAANWFVFYNNTVAPGCALQYFGDNREGGTQSMLFGEASSESISIDLSKIPTETTEISFVASIYDAKKKKQCFGNLKDAVCRLYNQETGELLAAYKLDSFGDNTSIQLVSLHPDDNNNWTFTTLGAGFNCPLDDIVAQWQ